MPEDQFGAHPKSLEELSTFIRERTSAQHDYSASAEALHDVAVAAFNFAASSLGVTGFQGSYAALKFVGTVNGWRGPYGVLRAEDVLYPQYPSPQEKAEEMAAGWGDWLAEQARKKLAEYPEVTWRTITDDEGNDPVKVPNVAPRVHEHWKRLAALAPYKKQEEG